MMSLRDWNPIQIVNKVFNVGIEIIKFLTLYLERLSTTNSSKTVQPRKSLETDSLLAYATHNRYKILRLGKETDKPLGTSIRIPLVSFRTFKFLIVKKQLGSLKKLDFSVAEIEISISRTFRLRIASSIQVSRHEEP